jgi:hypothetical protein
VLIFDELNQKNYMDFVLGRNRDNSVDAQQIRGNTFGSVINFIILLACIIIIIIACLILKPSGCNDNTRILSVNCTDCRSCTNDYMIGNTYCKSFPVLDDQPCASSQQCFNSSICSPTCIQGQCNNGPLPCCKGYCIDDADCPILNTSALIPGGLTGICQEIFNSCYYTIFNTFTDDCLSLIFPIELRECLQPRFTITLDNVGQCNYVFKCAPQYFGIGVESVSTISTKNISIHFNSIH